MQLISISKQAAHWEQSLQNVLPRVTTSLQFQNFVQRISKCLRIPSIAEKMKLGTKNTSCRMWPIQAIFFAIEGNMGIPAFNKTFKRALPVNEKSQGSHCKRQPTFGRKTFLPFYVAPEVVYGVAAWFHDRILRAIMFTYGCGRIIVAIFWRNIQWFYCIFFLFINSECRVL